jgi:hypothetical protein
MRLRVGETASLDGSKSVTNSAEPLGFNWTLSSKPDASAALLQDATTANPQLCPHIP